MMFKAMFSTFYLGSDAALLLFKRYQNCIFAHVFFSWQEFPATHVDYVLMLRSSRFFIYDLVSCRCPMSWWENWMEHQFAQAVEHALGTSTEWYNSNHPGLPKPIPRAR
ncbi:hypothetical protein MN608_00565 [Microdochium nivale]|nr:hypothetical protein MN608_00565 [Microdochium nivale]